VTILGILPGVHFSTSCVEVIYFKAKVILSIKILLHCQKYTEFKEGGYNKNISWCEIENKNSFKGLAKKCDALKRFVKLLRILFRCQSCWDIRHHV